MKYVYIIQSVKSPDQFYTGVTDNVQERLAAHNEGKSLHTSKFIPWKILTFIAFQDDSKAISFEQYLKSGSGRAFSNKHFK